MRSQIWSITWGVSRTPFAFTDDKNIETLGCLTRIRSEDDRRNVQFVLTEKTRDVLANDLSGTCGRENKLDFALTELGKVVRIGLLDPDYIREIQR